MGILNVIMSALQSLIMTLYVILKELLLFTVHVIMKTIDNITTNDMVKEFLYYLKGILEYIITELEKDIRIAVFMSFVAIIASGMIFRSIIWRKTRTLNDKIKQLQDCKKDLWSLIDEKNCNPLMLRLAWSDACTYDRTVRKWPACGGANGYVRLEKIYNNPVNAGLSKAIALLAPIKEKYTCKNNTTKIDALSEVAGEASISWADIIQMAGAVAVQHAGGPRIPIRYGRIDAPFSEQLLKQIKPELLMPCANPPYYDGTGSADVHVRNVFYNRMGFTNQEIVALSGGHTLGRGFHDRSGVTDHSSGDQGATDYTRQTCIVRADGKEGVGMPGGCSWTKNWLTFDNSYYTILHTHQSKRRSSAALSIASSTKEKERNSESEQADTDESFSNACMNPKAPLSNSSSSAGPNSNAKSPKSGPCMGDADSTIDTTQLLWTSTDKAVAESPEFSGYFRQFAGDSQAWLKEYVAAHVKFSNLGVRFLPPDGIDINSVAKETK